MSDEQKTIDFIFRQAWNQEMEDWWIANFEELYGIIPENLHPDSKTLIELIREKLLR